MRGPQGTLFVAVAVAFAVVTLGGCGRSSGTTRESSATTDRGVSGATASRFVAPGPPLAVALAVDSTLEAGPNAKRSKRSLGEYAEDAAILISSAIERGGSFGVSVFAGPGHAIAFKRIILDPKAAPHQRYEKATKHYGPMAITVDQAVGEMPRSGKIARQLAALPAGTAVGEALREAVDAVHGKPGERWAVVATDGYDTTHGALPLPNVQATAKVLRKTVGNLDASGVGIAMVGVGLHPPHDSWQEDGPLTKAWAIVCHEIHARQCQIHADPRPPKPLEGTAHAILEGI
jgi:hypothetical protein